MLYDLAGFRLYNIDGELITEKELPDADFVVNPQYSKKSGNLAVMYKDALRIYSGVDGTLLFEETGLKSVFFAPYGVSVLGADQSLRLIDIDTGATAKSFSAQGDFAAYCGMVVDESFLSGRKLIGAGRYMNGYAFAVSDGFIGTVYDHTGKKLTDISVSNEAEVFFARDIVIISPLHGTPQVINIKTGRHIADLEKDALLCYVTLIGDYILTEYLDVSNGERYGLLLDINTCQPLARLPLLTDTFGDKLLFDCTGTLRQSPIYLIEELKAMIEIN
jgi:hypothetical protein